MIREHLIDMQQLVDVTTGKKQKIVTNEDSMPEKRHKKLTPIKQQYQEKIHQIKFKLNKRVP